MAMADVKNSRCKKRVEDLPMDVLNTLSMHLNPKMVCGGDWTTLAGKFEMKYIEIKNFEREQNPTLAVLHKWWSETGDKTVSHLIDIFEEMKRNDVVKLLKPYEFYEGPSDQSQPCGEENLENEEDENTAPLFALPSAPRPGELPLANGITNGNHEGNYHEDFHSESQYSIGGTISNKGQLSENLLDAFSYAIASDVVVDTDSQDELDDTSGMFHGRGSRKRAELSVQTQVPSPTVGNEAPSFPSPAEERQEAANDAISPGNRLTAPHDKIALVIGNLNYKKKQFDKLSHTMNDAFDIALVLEELHFKVISLVDLTLTEMRTCMLAFCRLLGPGIYAAFYYAGHGYELDGENYLLPVDAMSASPNESIRAQEFLQEMQNCNTLLNLMFLDCCRTRAKDNKSPRCSLKRGSVGNTVIAYSCCTQHEAFEEPNQKNGVYARHILQHIKRDTRIENILMDVSSAVVASRSVIQRPTFESDAYLECRLTAPIFSEPGGEQMRERCELWMEGVRLPEPIETTIGDASLTLEFIKCFSNLMHVNLYITNFGQNTMTNCQFEVNVAEPLEVVAKTNQREFEPSDQRVHFGEMRISRLQKLYNETIFLTIDFETDDEKHIKKFDFGRPLISGITGSFHEWIKDRKYELPSGAPSSWI